MEENKEIQEVLTSESDEMTAEICEKSAKMTEEELHGENLNERVKVLSPGMTVAKRFFRSKLSVVGLAVIIFLFLFSFLGPLFSPWSANEGTVRDFNAENIKITGATTPVTYTGPDGKPYEAISVIETTPLYNIYGDINGDHWMGTDSSGYDVFTRLMYGGRVSLTIGFIVIILETLIGAILGGISGYFGGWVDQLIMRIVDILSCIPSLPIMLILGAVLDMNGLDSSISKLYIMMGVLTLIGWAGTARLVRGQILSLREQEFMLAAKCSGLSTSKKIFKHLLPNVIPQLIVTMTLGLGSIILMEATLGFLGIGAPVSTPTWGNMINFSASAINRNYYPNLWLGAGVCITLAILAFNFVGDGLRDAFDPKMKR